MAAQMVRWVHLGFCLLLLPNSNQIYDRLHTVIRAEREQEFLPFGPYHLFGIHVLEFVNAVERKKNLLNLKTPASFSMEPPTADH